MSTTSDDVDARPIEHELSLRQAVESVLLTTAKPISAAKLVEPLRDAGFETDRKAIEGAIE
ncbi:MAG: hypothetical protein AAFO89_03975, partial [Planctomycetota bacterium]